MARPQRHRKIPRRYIADDFLSDGPFQLLFCEETESFHIVARKHVTTVRQGLATVIKEGVLARGIVKFSGITLLSFKKACLVLFLFLRLAQAV